MGQKFHKRALACGAALAVLAMATSAAAAQRNFNIPAEPAAKALPEFARQAGIQLVAPVGQLHGVMTHEVRGSLEVQNALAALISGTGLVVASNDGAVVSLKMADAGPQSSGASRPAGGPSNAEAAANSAPTTVAEVLVTVNKRTENVQNVAASVSVQSGAQLESRHQLQLIDYANYVPGLDVGNGGKAGLSTVTLRGIASVSAGASVSAYLDETPMGSSSLFGYASNQILDVLPYDLDRLEVLRGPQGTLYGAGSMGGLIKYVLKTPNTSRFEARVGADLETIDGAGDMGYSIRGTVNLPLAEDVAAVRISLFDQNTPGYINNAWTGGKDVNAQRQNGGRVALIWKPSSDLSVKLNAVVSHNAADDSGTVSYGAVIPVATTDGANIARLGSPYGDLTENHAFPQVLVKNITLLSSVIDWNPGSVDVVSATSWARQRTHVTADQSLAFAPIAGPFFGLPGGLLFSETTIGLDKFTQELRVASKQGQPLEWLVGGFYTHESSFQRGHLDVFDSGFHFFAPLSPFLTNDLETTYQEYAIFGDLTYHFTEKFDVTGGLRYARNTQKWSRTSGGVFAGPAGGTSTQPPSSEGVTTWSAAARYHLTTDAMVYGRIATGYRPGGPNAPTPSAPATVGPDTLTSYETGIKSQFADHRGLFDLTVFWIDWKDIQLQAVKSGFGYVANGGAARSKGIELTTSYSPVQDLTLGLNAAYTDAQLTSIIAGANFMTGYQLPGVPKLSFSVTADYDVALPDGWNGHLNGGVRWVDKEWLTGVEFGPGSVAAIQAPSYTLVNLNASVTKDHLTFKAFATNLTNQRAFQGGIGLIDFFNNPVQGDIWIAQPRTVGVGVDYTF